MVELKTIRFIKNTGRWLTAIFFLVYCVCPIHTKAQTTAAFSANDSIGCVPFSVTFTNNSTAATNYIWDFGNGTTSSLPNPNVVYVGAGTFTVTLIAENAITGNSDTLVAGNLITVAADPFASFNTSTTTGCSNTNQIVFNNTSTGSTNYSWDFGDGNGSNLLNPVHHYTNAGTYTVILIANNNLGCSDIAIQANYITIDDAPDATFSSNITSTCDSNDVFNFSTSDPSITSWNWDFGNGTTSSLPNPVYSYGSSGSFDVTLIVASANGCYDTLTVNNYINIGSNLVPTFTTNPATGCAPLSTQFNSTVPNAISWIWNFGDGSTANTSNPIHTYNNPGSYTVTLTVNTSNGCNGTISIPNHITVLDQPQSNFTVSANIGCLPLAVSFNNNSTNASTFYWDFGDGTTSSAASPSHTYTTAGLYNVMLVSSNSVGCTDTLIINNAVAVSDIIADFSATPTIGCSTLPVNFSSNVTGNPTTWIWYFGDGTSSSIANPSHNFVNIGDYDITLIVSNAIGCSDTIVRPAFISVVPDTTPYIVPDTINGCAPQPLGFYDPTTGSNSWNWDFGDGDTSSQQNPSHIYFYPGVYTVTLNTGMAGGCTQDFNPYAIILIDSFTIDDNIITQVTNCPAFQFTCSNPTLSVGSYFWNFGDGNTSDIASPSHSYTSSGTYVISLSMTMVNGCVFTRHDTVTVGYPNPIVASYTGLCLDDSVQFTVSDSSIWVSAIWDFGDSTSSSLLHPKHIYDSVGDYIISVELIDTIGCVYNYTLPGILTVRDPQPSFTISPNDTACDVLVGNFINNSINATSYWWGFGDGTTTHVMSPSHTYNTPGNYNVSLIAANSGCSRTITIYDAIVIFSATANFTYTQSSYCFPATVQFQDSSINAVSWFWDFGDGSTSNISMPSHTFSSYPSSPVTLTIVDDNGCTATISKTIDFANTSFTASDTLGCSPLTVYFSSITSGATTWHWDFGDGNSSSLAFPSNTYANDGAYNVALFATYPQGCVDTIHMDSMIVLNSPTASFNSPTISICAPSEVFFTNTSLNASTYLWDFGDGVTSTEFEPSHIYSVPGYYTITLIAYSPYGCSDTAVLQNYIEIPGSYAQFGYEGIVGCETFTAHFSDSSINANSWVWNFGDGSTSSAQNPTHVYGDTGTYNVSLFVADTGSCSSFISFPIHVTFEYFPTASGSAGANLGGCAPYAVPFTNNSSANATNFIWHFGDGDTSHVYQPTHLYTDAGLFYPMLIALTSTGCADTLRFLTPINILQSPDAQFIPDLTQACYGSVINFQNQSTGLSSPVYLWAFGNGNSSSQVNPSVTYTQAGNYNVSLLVINANGCRDSIDYPNLISIADTMRPAQDTILSASVIANDQIEIVWKNSDDTDLKAYELYRRNAMGQFVLIHTDLNPQNSVVAFSTTYIDSNVNTLLNSYSYKLRTVDECDQAAPLSSLTIYTTIELTANAVGQNVALFWNEYEGCPVSQYTIERTEVASGSTQIIASLAAGSTQFNDTTILCPLEYRYKIIATDLCGTTYSSHSDTSHATPDHPILQQSVDVSRSTVFQDQYVLTEWNPPSILPSRVVAYLIMRSEDNISFTPIGTVSAPITQYIDNTADVHNKNYYYKVSPINDCQLAGQATAIGSNILLQAEKPDEFHTILYWSRYEGWTNGVKNYVIEKLDKNNNWQFVKVVPSTITKVKLNE